MFVKRGIVYSTAMQLNLFKKNHILLVCIMKSFACSFYFLFNLSLTLRSLAFITPSNSSENEKAVVEFLSIDIVYQGIVINVLLFHKEYCAV